MDHYKLIKYLLDNDIPTGNAYFDDGRASGFRGALIAIDPERAMDDFKEVREALKYEDCI